MKQFKDKVALITGAGNGFGQEFAKEAARRGMRLYLVDIDADDLARTGRTVSDMGAQVATLAADLSLESGVASMVDGCMAEYGRIDLLINNAGIAIPGEVDKLPSRDWEWIVNINCMSHVWSMQRVIPIMRGQGGECHIVNVASLAALTTMPGMPAYFATKHFALALSESVYYDLRQEGSSIGLSCFCPGFIKTDLHHCERHRPKRYQAPDDPYYASAHFAEGQKRAEYEIMNGTELDPVGPYVFRAIEEERFYIEIHPETKTMIKHRNRDIVKERNPDVDYVNLLSDLSHGIGKTPGNLLKVILKR